MRYVFDAADCERFLTPACHHVGASFREDDSTNSNFIDQLPRFQQEGVWENGYREEVPRFRDRTLGLRKGDVLIAKRLQGMAQSNVQIRAVGIVVALNPHQPYTVKVEWVLPNVDIVSPLYEVGTISMGRPRADLPPAEQNLVTKAQARFLRYHLDIQQTHY